MSQLTPPAYGSMKKSPSGLFKILQEEDEESQMRRVRESLEGSTGRAYSGRSARLWGSGDAIDSPGKGAGSDADVASPPEQTLSLATNTTASSHATSDGVALADVPLRPPEGPPGAPAAPPGDTPADRAADPAVDPADAIAPKVFLRQMLGELYVDMDSLVGLANVAEGGFATVQSATLTHSNGMKQRVAIKKLKSHLISSNDFTEFVKEANLWRKLKSGDIVSVIGIGAMDVTNFSTIRSSLFVVSEFMEGGTLRDFVMNAMFDFSNSVYKMEDAFRWFVAITRGVKYLHGCLPIIIHRDLKLENILLTTKNTSTSDAKVVDLGLHMRGKHSVDLEGSFYGGNAFDAAKNDGSVRTGYTGAHAASTGQTLAEKVRMADSMMINAAMPSSGLSKASSPPTTNHRHPVVMLTIAEDPMQPEVSTFEASENEDPSAASQAKGDDPGVANENMLDLDFMPKNYKGKEDPNLDEQQQSSLPCRCLPSPKSPERRSDGGGTASSSVGGHRQSSSEGVKLPVTSNRGSSSGSAKTPGSGPELFTGQVGSFMYMCPEMVTSHSYNEKVDIFSLTVMLYETLRCYLNISTIAHTGDPDDVARYAMRVAKGYREKIPPYWPDEVRSLIERGWAQNPDDRPTASEFLKDLQKMIDDDVPLIMEARRPKRGGMNPKFDCGCCIS